MSSTKIRLTDQWGYDWVDYTLRSDKVVVVEIFKARPGRQSACRIARLVMKRPDATKHYKMMLSSLNYRETSRS
jgi:hypothetical protein